MRPLGVALLLDFILLCSPEYAFAQQMVVGFLGGARAAYARGLEHIKCGKYQEACEVLEAALRAYPSDVDLHESLGMAHGAMGRLDRSILERPKKREAEHDERDRLTAVPASVLERFKIAADGGFLLLPVVLQGKRYLFALDTGASHSCYDKSFRSLLGEPLRSEKVWTPSQDIIEPIFRSPAGKVGKLALPADSEALCVDLEKIREVSGQELHGLLGMDFLRKHVFRIDFDRGEVAFLRSVGSNPGERVPITFNGNYPYVLVEFPGFFGRGHFLVDTGVEGSGSGTLHMEAFATLAKLGALTLDGQTYMDTVSGTGTSRIGRVGAISLRGYRHEKLLFAESNRNILGLNYWSRYIVTFDFPNGVMYLEKGRKFDQPDVLDMSGLNILRRKGLTLVESIEKGSPAAQAGVKPQDVLLKIDDAKSSEMSLWGIRHLFCEKGKKYRLLVRRGENELGMTIYLRY